jgi:hypothetical protein
MDFYYLKAFLAPTSGLVNLKETTPDRVNGGALSASDMHI